MVTNELPFKNNHLEKALFTFHSILSQFEFFVNTTFIFFFQISNSEYYLNSNHKSKFIITSSLFKTAQILAIIKNNSNPLDLSFLSCII